MRSPCASQQLVAHAPDVVDAEGGRGVRVEQRGVVDVLAVALEHGLDGQLDDVEERAVQRDELRRQGADGLRVQTVAVDDAGNLDAALGREVLDQSVVAAR